MHRILSLFALALASAPSLLAQAPAAPKPGPPQDIRPWVPAPELLAGDTLSGEVVREVLTALESEPRSAPTVERERNRPEGVATPVWPVGVHRRAGSPEVWAVAAQLGPAEEYDEDGERIQSPPPAPWLSVGDSLSLFAREGGIARRGVVRARVWGGAGENAYCSTLLEPSGWGYFVEAPPSLAPEEDTHRTVVAVAASFRQARPLAETPAEARDRLFALFYPEYLAARDSLARTGDYPPEILGEPQERGSMRELADLLGQWASWKGEGGRSFHLLSISLQDDPSEHGGDTYRTYLLEGDQERRLTGLYVPVHSADFDGDGVREIIFQQGLAHYREGEWHLPSPGQSAFCD